jgi:hypothetical protein
MVRRSTETIDHLDGADTSVPATRTNVTKIEPVLMVDINYPDPTPLATIIRDVSRWSGQAFVMEPNLNARIQIFAPHKMTHDDAWNLFLASLSVVGLRAVQIGKIVKVVPSQTSIAV